MLENVLRAGAAGFKLHEDWGTTPAAIDAALTFADEHDVQITIHTDTLNESGFVDDSIAAMAGRIHTYHTEGAGGGHAPDIIKICSEEFVLPSSTNPTRPFTVNTIDEHLDMLMVCHHLDSSIPEDMHLQSLGYALRLSQPKTFCTTSVPCRLFPPTLRLWEEWAGCVAHVADSEQDEQRGSLPEDAGNDDDNERIKRYVAKVTINPALAHGFSKLDL